MTAPPRILFEDGRVLAVEKPPGVPVIPGRGEGGPTPLREQVQAAIGRPVWVVHRLDRDTSGVVLFALDASAHRALSMAFEAGRVEKRYLALVAGRVEAPLDIDRALVPARRGRMRVARPSETGKPARTQVRPLEAFESSSWVEARPLTGRTHQIRVHLAFAGHPLLVDHQYGRPEPVTARALGGEDDEPILVRTPLHAERLELPALDGMPPRTFSAPLPPDMARALETLRSARAQPS